MPELRKQGHIPAERLVLSGLIPSFSHASLDPVSLEQTCVLYKGPQGIAIERQQG